MPVKASKGQDLYNADFYRWATETAAALRRKRVEGVDFQIVAGELEDLGRTEQRELRNRLRQLLLHLLKWKYQPAKRSVSWQASVDLQRLEIQENLERNPSLKRQLPDLLPRAYQQAMRLAVRQTKLPYETFPNECPFTLREAIAGDLEKL